MYQVGKGEDKTTTTSEGVQLNTASEGLRLSETARGVITATLREVVNSRTLGRSQATHADTSPDRLGAKTVLDNVPLTLEHGLSTESMKEKFKASFTQHDGKSYLSYIDPSTGAAKELEVGKDTDSIECSVRGGVLHIRLINKPNDLGVRDAQFATIDKAGSLTIHSREPAVEIPNQRTGNTFITERDHPEFFKALVALKEAGYSFSGDGAAYAKSEPRSYVLDSKGNIVQEFSYGLLDSTPEKERLKNWASQLQANLKEGFKD